jgi:hypothetical protein
LAYGDGAFVTNNGQYSTDGINRTKATYLSAFGSYGNDIAYGNGRFVIIGTYHPPGDYAMNAALISIDGGRTWALGGGCYGYYIAYGDGMFITADTYSGWHSPEVTQGCLAPK